MKQTTKQIKAQLINELSKKYKESYGKDVKFFQGEYKRVEADNQRIRKKFKELKNRNEELEQKVLQYEDWIHRLQEWCNLPDNEREEAIKKYKEDKKVSEMLGSFTDMFSPYMNLFNF